MSVSMVVIVATQESVISFRGRKRGKALLATFPPYSYGRLPQPLINAHRAKEEGSKVALSHTHTHGLSQKYAFCLVNGAT
ncbi:unnamed protein product [Caenorhabditis auriculariae]|uniref:Uncharacterized protein n=1 Tax=Caenorhabditis auriculariae TaxID=2777116 RepID=A0A8S1HN30_9PELO|nr:unnamed protein product [Caenorhabditis auriculariae]